MQLRCKVCAAIQSVNTADAEDEDLRTQGIRRTFRAAHVEQCGAGSVVFEMDAATATSIDPAIWHRYLAHAMPPADVTEGADGFFTRSIVRDGVTHHVRVCEDCWQNIPRYIDFPAGLISPESDGDHVEVPKVRVGTVETDSPARAQALEHLWKAVCLPCYLAAFQRVYPGATLPELRSDVVGDGAPVQPPPPTSPEEVGRVSLSRIGREVMA